MRKQLFLMLIALLYLSAGLLLSCGCKNSRQRPSRETWRDSTSGLMWQVQPTGGAMKWQEAKSHCENLDLGGFSDWRLPTILELRSLIRGCPATQQNGTCGVTDSCLNLQCRNDACDGCPDKGGPAEYGRYWPPELSGDCCWYWSASAIADAAYGEWLVYFQSGYVYGNHAYIGYDLKARCVR